MCGRFGFELPPKSARDRFGLEVVEDYAPRRNVAPTTEIAVIISQQAGQDLVRTLLPMRWGLVPFWAKNPAMGAKMINARCETAAEKPAFRAAFKRRRCLIPAGVFYEWHKKEDGKQPYAIGLQSGKAFAMAGLWEHWQGGDGSELLSAAILTCAANELVAPIHERMPVLLPEDGWGHWLDPQSDPQQLQALLAPYDAAAMCAWPVSRAVNNPRNQDFPLEPEPDQRDEA